MKRSTLSFLLAGVFGVSIASTAPGDMAVPYSDPTQVNLLRRVDINGNLPLVTASSVPGYPHDPARGIDAGMQPWRLGSHNTPGGEFWRVELPEAVNLTSLDIFWRGGYFATDFTVKGSLTGFGSLKDLVTPVVGNADNHPVVTFPSTSVKFLEIRATGFSDPAFYILHEVEARGPAPIIQGTGYNMLAQAGKLDTITPAMSLNVVDPVVQAGDNNVNTFVRGINTPAADDNAFFVLPLIDSARLMAISLGMYEDQPWTDVQVYLSNDAAYDYDSGSNTWPGMTWTQVFDFNQALLGNFGGAHFTLTPQMTKFIRVDWPADSRAGAALNEVQLFETYIPEPATAMLLTCGLAMIVRRRVRQ